jgi:hypothetical protein
MIQLTVDELNKAYELVLAKAKHTSLDVTDEIKIDLASVSDSPFLTPQELNFKFFPELKQGKGAWIIMTDIEVVDLEEV